MAKFTHFNIKGTEFDVPAFQDERLKPDIERDPDFLGNSVYTPKGGG